MSAFNNICSVGWQHSVKNSLVGILKCWVIHSSELSCLQISEKQISTTQHKHISDKNRGTHDVHCDKDGRRAFTHPVQSGKRKILTWLVSIHVDSFSLYLLNYDVSVWDSCLQSDTMKGDGILASEVVWTACDHILLAVCTHMCPCPHLRIAHSST